MIKLFADGADINSIKRLASQKEIKGFTTNPTLMKQAGITDYEKFSREVISYLAENRPDTCLSLEVFADEMDEMARQAHVINSWSKEYNYSVYVKIPVTNTKQIPNFSLMEKLSNDGIRLNVTALFTPYQIISSINSLHKDVPAIISVFAGRIADTGVNPVPIIEDGMSYVLNECPNAPFEFLWASPREAYNYVQAEECGCHIITMSEDQIKKVLNFGKSLQTFSLETVNMFYNDAVASGFKI